MPFEDVRVERLEPAEQLARHLDEPQEGRDAEAEVRGDEPDGTALAKPPIDGCAIGLPAGRADDEPSASGHERDVDVAGHGVAPRRIDDELSAGEIGDTVSLGVGATENAVRPASCCQRRPDGPAKVPVPEDDRLHIGPLA